MLIFTDDVLARIEADIASHRPERGGALLGFPDANIVCDFIYDEWGATTGASYVPSAQLTQVLQQRERATGLMFKGVVHSHPGGLDRLSGPDHAAIEEAFVLNAHLPYFIAPIVTLDRDADESRSQEIALGRCARMTVHFCERPRYAISDGPSVQPASENGKKNKKKKRGWFSGNEGTRPKREAVPVPYIAGLTPVEANPKASRVMPLRQHLGELDRRMDSAGWRLQSADEFAHETLEGAAFLKSTRLYRDQAHALEAMFLFPPTYPYSPPVLLRTLMDGSSPSTDEVRFEWSFGQSAQPAALAEACAAALAGNIFSDRSELWNRPQ
jgi:hypothetical protein